MANVILTNGARLYVDHAHPEYSSPEVTTALDVVPLRQGGRAVMADGRRSGAVAVPPGRPIQLYKNNTDGKGASYGTHENYLLQPRHAVRPSRHASSRAFFVTRQVFTGAGRVGIGQDEPDAGFQISQRADFFEAEVGLETTLKRPIINTRDEPHADADQVPPPARDHRRREPLARSPPTSRSAPRPGAAR